MRELVVTVAVLFVSLPSMAVIPIRPTTTLAAETGNNTSAANSFAAQRNGNLNAGNVSKMPIRNLLYGGASSKIYAHFMPWFGPSNHMNVGYDSSDPAQVKRQVEDMISRGIDGALVDWYGPGNTHHNTTTINLMQESELHPGFEFAVVEDGGALKNAADPQQKLIDDLNYVYSTFEPSPAYMRRDGRPVILFFGVESYTIDWDAVRAAVLGNPLFIFRNSGAFTKPQTNGGYAWLSPQTTLTAGYMSLGYLDDFYSTALKYPLLETFGSGFKGFDDSLAAWGKNRKILQFCGQTWLSSMAEAGKYYNSSTQLENLQIVTWNDYEEGTEIETGVDNCFTVTASVTGSMLNWSITGDETTIDHYTVLISLDGQNLMPLSDLAAGTYSLDLASFDLGPASYTLYVKVVGKPSMVNHVSGAVAYTPRTVMISNPAKGATMNSPVEIVATASTPYVLNALQIYLDGVLNYEQTSPNLDQTRSFAPGSHSITVKGWDQNGSFMSKITITVNAPPTAKLAVTPASGARPVNVTASTAGSSDSDGTIDSTIIDFGDGSSASVAAGGSADHVYSTPGTYTVTSTVTDNIGAQDTATSSVTVVAPYITITTPLDGGTYTSPVHVTANTVSGNPIDAMKIYVDDVSKYKTNGASLDTNVKMAKGARRLTVQSWETNGTVIKNTVNITVK